MFLAEDPVLGRKVALKVPRVEVLSHGEAWRRFLREAQAASRLDHPNLVPLLETGEIGPVGYIASVYVEGPSLEAWLAQQQSRVPPRQAARLVATLARAMDHAHQRGILHRDLKPANVLLQEVGARGVCDSLREAQSPSPSCPGSATSAWPSCWMSKPRRAGRWSWPARPRTWLPSRPRGGREGLGPATDVYGLGAILYELLAGRPPFRGKTSLETLRQVVADEPVARVACGRASLAISRRSA